MTFWQLENSIPNTPFDSILKEDDPGKGKLEEVLYEFAGVTAELKLEEIEIPLRLGRSRKCRCRILP